MEKETSEKLLRRENPIGSSESLLSTLDREAIFMNSIVFSFSFSFLNFVFIHFLLGRELSLLCSSVKGGLSSKSSDEKAILLFRRGQCFKLISLYS